MAKSTFSEPELTTLLLQKIGNYWSDLSRLSSSQIDIQKFWEPSECVQAMMTHAYDILQLYLKKDSIPILDRDTISILDGSMKRYLKIKWSEVEATIIFDFLKSDDLNKMKYIHDFLSRTNIFIVLLPHPPSEDECRIASDLRDSGISMILMCPSDFNAFISARWNFIDLLIYKTFRILLLGKKDIEGIYEKFTLHYFKSLLDRIKINPPELDLDAALKSLDIKITELLEHPVFKDVQKYLSTDNSVLIFGPSSSGKTSLALRTAHNIHINLEKDVWYFDVSSSGTEEVVHLGIRLLDRGIQSKELLLVLDDLQTNPDIARQILLFSSHFQRLVFGNKLQIIGTSWPDLKYDIVTTGVDFTIVDIDSSQLAELMTTHYGNRLNNNQIWRIKEIAGDDLFVLKLALIISNDVGRALTPNQIAEEFWKRRTEHCNLSMDKIVRAILVASIIGQYECEVTKTFLMSQTGITETEIDELAKSKLIRYHRGLINAGHRSLCTIMSNYLGMNDDNWEWFRKHNKPTTPEGIVVEFIFSLPPSQIWPILKSIHTHVGFKTSLDVGKGLSLVDYWQNIDYLLEKIINQQKDDPTWGQIPSSVMFVVETLSTLGMYDEAKKSIEFLRDSYLINEDGLFVKSDKLATTHDFQQIKKKMIIEDMEKRKKESTKIKIYEPAEKIDENRFHENWVRGLILCAEAAYSEKSKSELTKFAELVEKSAHESGYFYPARVPWCTARVLIGLGACGRNIHNSETVKKAADWLLTPRIRGGALEDGVWTPHTGGWNSPIETTAMCITALVAVGIDKKNPIIVQVMNNLFENKSEWTKQGSELDGVTAIESYSLLNRDWKNISSELQSISRWTRGQALWLYATKRSDETFTQSCRITQVAATLIKLTWKRMSSDLPSLLKIFAISETESKYREAVGELRTHILSKERPKIVSEKISISPNSVMEIIRKFEYIDPSEFYVVDGYTKFDESKRNNLKDFFINISEAILSGSDRRENYLIWGLPGSGKTYLIERMANALKNHSDYWELNLSKTERGELLSKLHDIIKATDLRNVICLIDEIDSKKEESWPFEILLSFLDANKQTTHSLIWILAGSTEEDIEKFVELLKTRFKGKDLLSRIPTENIIEIPPPALEDRILLAVSYIRKLSAYRRTKIEFIEKFALFYLMTSSELNNPRQMEDFIHAAIKRVGLTENRLKYDHLFYPGDLKNKEFWKSYELLAKELSDAYIKITIEVRSE